MNGLTDTILKMMDTTQEPEDYKGEDGLMYCGKCHKPKEAYFPQGKELLNVTVAGQNVKGWKKRN